MFAKLLIASALLTTPVPAAEVNPSVTANLDVATDATGAVHLDSRAAGEITVDLTTATGVIATRLAEADVVRPGESRTLDAHDRTLADGVYRGRVRLVRDDGRIETAETPVVIDRTEPRVRLRAEASAPTSGPARFRVRVDDASPLAESELVVEAPGGQVLATIAMTPPAVGRWDSVRWNGRLDGRRAMPGLYLVRVRVVDAAGNVGRSPVRKVRVQRAVQAQTVSSAPRARGRVALTFDDCASAESWRRLLDGLRETGVRGTFFCNGRNVAAYPDLARRTVAEGHVIGSHTWDHPIMPRLSVAGQREQIRRDTAVWWRVAQAVPMPYFRSPYGSQDASTLAAVGAEGYAFAVLWDVDPRDWEEPGAGVVVDRVVSRSRAGSIVVLHTARSTAAGLPEMVRRLRAKGLEPVALDEMTGLTPGARG